MNRKEQVLLDSFNVLKDNVNKNHEQLAKILAQLQGSQPNTVLDLWHYLLDANWDHVVQDMKTYGTICTYLTNDIMFALERNSGFSAFFEYLISDAKILKALYQYSPNFGWLTQVISKLLIQKNWEKATEIFELMYSNKKNNFLMSEELVESAYSGIFKAIIEDHMDEFDSPEEVYEFLSYFCL